MQERESRDSRGWRRVVCAVRECVCMVERGRILFERGNMNDTLATKNTVLARCVTHQSASAFKFSSAPILIIELLRLEPLAERLGITS